MQQKNVIIENLKSIIEEHDNQISILKDHNQQLEFKNIQLNEKMLRLQEKISEQNFEIQDLNKGKYF